MFFFIVSENQRPRFTSKLEPTSPDKDQKPRFHINNITNNVSNLSLESMGLKATTLPSRVTEKFVSKNVPDIVSSTLSYSSPSKYCPQQNKSHLNRSPFSINKSIFKKADVPNIPEEGRFGDDRKSDVFADRKNSPAFINKNSLFKRMEAADFAEGDPSVSSGKSNSLVRNIIETLNRKDKGRFDVVNRNTFGRSSLKVMGSPKVKLGNPQLRSCSPEEYTAL